jgi:hypothetical protein
MAQFHPWMMMMMMMMIMIMMTRPHTCTCTDRLETHLASQRLTTPVALWREVNESNSSILKDFNSILNLWSGLDAHGCHTCVMGCDECVMMVMMMV